MSKVSRVSRKEDVRPKRIPVSANRAPLTVKGFDHANFQGRWVNDVDDRLAIFLEGGYEFVTRDNGTVAEPTMDATTKLDSRVKKPVGRGVTAYLMRLPKELWLEDQAAKERELKEIDRAMKAPGTNKADYGKVQIGNEIKDDPFKA
ncbi:MAG: hypothetical protein ACYC9R_12740 [Nitrosotalea sp.]